MDGFEKYDAWKTRSPYIDGCGKCDCKSDEDANIVLDDHDNVVSECGCLCHARDIWPDDEDRADWHNDVYLHTKDI